MSEQVEESRGAAEENQKHINELTKQLQQARDIPDVKTRAQLEAEVGKQNNNYNILHFQNHFFPPSRKSFNDFFFSVSVYLNRVYVWYVYVSLSTLL